MRVSRVASYPHPQTWSLTLTPSSLFSLYSITSHRIGDTDVPRAEPLPAKALVIEADEGVLPAQLSAVPGVHVRTSPGRLAQVIPSPR